MGRRTLIGCYLDITVPGNEWPIFAPARVFSQQTNCLGCTVTGGDLRRVTEATSGQEILLMTPAAAEVSFRYAFSDRPGLYPEAIFHPAPSRHTR